MSPDPSVSVTYTQTTHPCPVQMHWLHLRKSVPDEIASVGWGEVWNTPIRECVCVTGAERGKRAVEEPKDCCHDCVRSACSLSQSTPGTSNAFLNILLYYSHIETSAVSYCFEMCCFFLWRQVSRRTIVRFYHDFDINFVCATQLKSA